MRGLRARKTAEPTPAKVEKKGLGRKQNPLEHLIATATYRVLGTVLQTQNKAFRGVRATSATIPFGKEIMGVVNNGIISICLTPAEFLAKGLLAQLTARYQQLVAQQAAPTIIAAYKTAIERIKDAPQDYAVVSISAVGETREQELPPGVVYCPPFLRNLTRPGVYVGVFRISNLSNFLPSYAPQPTEYYIPFARSSVGESLLLPVGSPGNARHTLIIGMSGSGKSTLAKYIIYLLTNSKYGIPVYACDMKGEYTIKKDKGLFGLARWDALNFRYGLGLLTYRTLQQEGKYDERTKAIAALEAFAASMFLEELGFNVPEVTISGLIHDACQRAHNAQQVVNAVYREIEKAVGGRIDLIFRCLGSPDGKIPAPAVSTVLDFSGYPFCSASQVAATLFSLPFIIHATPLSAQKLSILLLEEAHLIPGRYLGTLLRLARAKGIGLCLVTQGLSEIAALGSGKEQFSSFIYLWPSWEQVQNVLDELYCMNVELPQWAHKEFAQLPKKPGVGIYYDHLTRAIYPIIVTIPKGALDEIHKAADIGTAGRTRSVLPAAKVQPAM